MLEAENQKQANELKALTRTLGDQTAKLDALKAEVVGNSDAIDAADPNAVTPPKRRAPTNSRPGRQLANTTSA